MTTAGEGETKLYAGKFKTVEELEQGYKSSLPAFQENETLKQKLKDVSTVPDTYMHPDDAQIEDQYKADIQARAKEAGLTQAQYERLARNEKNRIDAQQQSFENARKEVGEQTLNILKDYITKHYPKELEQTMLNTFIKDKAARQAALSHRDTLLNNQVPGMNKTPPATGYMVTDDDVNKAYAAKEKNRGDIKARNHYLNLLAARAAQQKGS